MENFVEVARVEDIPPGTAAVADVKGVEIAVVNAGGEFYALSNECTHAGGSMGEGELIDERSLECPLHGSVFDVTTGEVIGPPAEVPLETYPTKVENGVVKVAVD